MREPFYQEPRAVIYEGHALDVLSALATGSVDCVMTSPPYWGLRTYKTEPQIWGDNHCEHDFIGDGSNTRIHKGWSTGTRTVSAGSPSANYDHFGKAEQGQFCLKCNAWRGELGLEPTIELYISHLIQIFNEVKRVLKKTGTCWVNIDDSYAGSGSPGGDFRDGKGGDDYLRPYNRKGLPAKSLCLIPSRFALAMVEQGWILRNDIVWNKPNPMPESVKDRLTTTWEHLFFFVKSQHYYFEQQFDEYTGPLNRWGGDTLKQETVKTAAYKDMLHLSPSSALRAGNKIRPNDLGRNKRDVVAINTESFGAEMCVACETVYDKSQFRALPEKPSKKCPCELGDIPIWEVIPWVGYRCGYCSTIYDKYEWGKLDGANTKICRCGESNWLSHFATFPEKLCETPSAICTKCGKARETIYKVVGHQITEAMRIAGCDSEGRYSGQDMADYQSGLAQSPSDSKRRILESMSEIKEAGYTNCGCNAGFEPGIVLDHFAGSGATGAVAKKLGRRYIGIELSPDYCKLHTKRLQEIPLAMELI